MNQISFKRLLNQIANQHFERKTQQYIQELEAVVAAVKEVKGVEKLEGGKDLTAAIKALEKYQ
jgi:hypothetical protein